MKKWAIGGSILVFFGTLLVSVALIGSVAALLSFGNSSTNSENEIYLTFDDESTQRAWTIWSELKKKGWTEEARAGLLGNADQETGGTFNPTMVEVGGGGGYGLIQWTPQSVLINHVSMAGIKEPYTSLKTQIEIIDWELNGVGRGYIPTSRYPISGVEFKQMKNLREAATAYEMNRERPRDPHPERQDMAQKWYDLFHGLTSAPTGKDDSKIVQTARKYLGVPYVWGGTTPTGFDCSGLVQYVFLECGVTKFKGLRVTTQQENAGKRIGITELQPGDLVFWGAVGTTHHVGIYIGNGEFIHAPQPGDKVKITKIKDFTPNFGVRVS